jgi:hypothetical protein
MMRYLALFQSTRAVITAERIMVKQGIRCKIIPVPRSISSECGMAIEIDKRDESAVRELCTQAGVTVEFVTIESPKQR